MHAMHLCMTEQRLGRRPTICGSTRAMAFIRHCERAPCPLAARVRETGTTRPLLDFVRGPPPGGMDCFASPTRNSEHSVRGSPFCRTRESGYPAGRDAATRGLRLAGVASRRNSVSVVVSWMPAFAGMTRGKRPIQAPVGLVQGDHHRPVRTRNDGESPR